MLKGFRSFINMTSPPQLSHLLNRMKKLGGDIVAGTERFPVYRIEANSISGEATLLVLAGHHGNEKSGPLGTLEYLEDNPDEKVRILAYPLLNAAGYERNERKDRTGKDINRTFYTRDKEKDSWQILRSFDGEEIRFALSLHEDPDLKGFYAYYNRCKSLAEKVRDAAEEYFTIQKPIPEPKKPKEGEPWFPEYAQIKDGLVKPPHVNRRTVEDKLADLGVPVLTLEVPGQAELSDRVKFVKEAIKLTAEYVRRAR